MRLRRWQVAKLDADLDEVRQDLLPRMAWKAKDYERGERRGEQWGADTRPQG